MKTVFFRTVFTAVIVIFALFLGTCAPELPEGGSAAVEYTDVEYELAGGNSRDVRVKSVKLYLDGKVPVTPKQRAIQRALSADTAAASHDFFEAVFVNGTTCVRVNWEIGYPAGISGPRLPDGNYGALTASTVFVGKKQNKTLLGVGKLTHVNDEPDAAGAKNSDTYSLTFTVAPLRTWVGTIGTTNNLRGKANWFGDGADATSGNATFTTGPTASTDYTTTTTAGVTRESFTPVQGRGDVYYPLYARPIVTATTPFYATYTIGGIVGTSITGAASLLPAIKVFGTRAATGAGVRGTNGVYTAPPKGGMQVIKRKPSFLFNGRTYQTAGSYDSFTSVNTNYPDPQPAHDSDFSNEIPIIFSVTNQSSGIFAITFQCPVYAITTAYAAQSGAADVPRVDFVRWFVRPADGPDLYLLDGGFDEGGMVMLGDRSSFTDDWIEIKTTGIGFDNN